jgi:hypothetical protein
MEAGPLIGHRQVAQEGQDLGVPVDRDPVVLAAFGVEVPQDSLAERPDPMNPGRPDAVLPGERGQALDRFLAALELDQERALGRVAKEPGPQGTGSQPATLGWSLSTAPTWAAPPGDV